MRTLVQTIRHGRLSDSELVSLGWHFSVLPLAIIGGICLLVLPVWGLALIAVMLFEENGLALLFVCAVGVIAMAVAGSAMMAVGACRQRTSSREGG